MVCFTHSGQHHQYGLKTSPASSLHNSIRGEEMIGTEFIFFKLNLQAVSFSRGNMGCYSIIKYYLTLSLALSEQILNSCNKFNLKSI